MTNQRVEPREKDQGRKGPTYRQIASALIEEINAGTWPVGAPLPTEADLSERFSVSRGTVRMALRELQDFGFLGKRRGAKSVVLHADAGQGFVNTAQSLDELLEYARFSQNAVLSSEMILMGEEQATDLGCEAGSEWLRIQVLRHRDAGSAPFSYAEIHVAAQHKAIGALYDGETPVYVALETQLGISIQRATQVIEVTSANRNIAQRLEVPVGSPMLRTKTFFYTADGELAEVGLAWFATDRYRMRITLDRKRSQPVG